MGTDETKVSVLIVDDQASNLLALEAILGDSGLNLVRARSGRDALIRVLDEDFAVILMDVQMPDMDGFEAAELIRGRDRSKHTPIIFLTAFHSNDEQVERGYALGAVDFLAKPIVPTVLRSKVSVFVELFQKTEQVRRQADQLFENQRQEHRRELSEERQRWEVERLREEAAREKKAAEELSRRAEELTLSIAERVRAEEQLRARAAQQAVVAELGRRALAGAELTSLLEEAVAAVVCHLGVEFGVITELDPAGEKLTVRAGVGWWEGSTVEAAELAVESSLSGYTLRTGSAVVVEDLRDERRFVASPLLRDHGVIGGISVVIQGRERPFGTLSVFSDRPRAYAQDDVHYLQSVANVLAAAIQRRRDDEELAAVRDELASQLADMTRLHALGARLSNSLELPAVLEEVLAAVTGLQGTDRGVLMLYDRERGAMRTAAAVGFSADQLDAVEQATPGLRANGSVTAVISGSIIVEDVESDPVLAPHLSAALRAGCHAVCSTPLLTCGGELIGSIATYFPRPHRPSDRETRLVELYARQAAEFIDNARLYREIRESDRQKGVFLAMLAHELRNPLAPILNALHVLRTPDADPEATAQARDIAERQVRHLARLVDDLLDVSRINTDKVELRRGPIDLREAVARAVEAARPLIEARGHELSVSVPDGPLRLTADEDRLEQILSNLLNNAAKYTEPGGRIALEVAREGDDAVVRVRDTGIGIAPELLPRVFDLFTQADRSLDRSQGGLGIGLTLVRRLVEMHGGSVSVSSAGVGRGSEFVVRLPLAAGDEAALPTDDGRVDEPADERPKRVLVVDDNVDAARILSRLLTAGGHHVDVAHDGQAALEIARERPPDVVLLDIGLPGMDGYEVARRMRAMGDLDRTLLVALTGYGQEEDRRRSRESGFDQHLTKPVDPLAIKQLIARRRPAERQVPEAIP
jgi:signal transduction histidine kinase/DNA-binding response OmpR family regulator